MSNSGKTLRLIFPDCQHGASPASGFVPRLLATIVPQCPASITEEVHPDPSTQEMTRNNLLASGAMTLLTEEEYRGIYDTAREMIDEKSPGRIISFSTDGAVSLCPIDYLHEQYEDLGVLWIDVHPEPVTPERFWKKRTVVFGAITGNEESSIRHLMRAPVDPDRFFYVCSRSEEIPMADHVQFGHLGIRRAGRDALGAGNPETILSWIREKGIRHLAVHVDMDSVGAADLRGGIQREQSSASLCQSDFRPVKQMEKLFSELHGKVNVVGFDVMEYELMNAPEFKEAVRALDIFNE